MIKRGSFAATCIISPMVDINPEKSGRKRNVVAYLGFEVGVDTVGEMIQVYKQREWAD